MSRPSRSDAHLSPVDEAVRVAEVREYYDDAAPKRHTKPSRSEHSAVYTDDALVDSSHPELDKLQELEAHTEVSQTIFFLHPSVQFRSVSNCELWWFVSAEAGARGRQGGGGVRGDGVLQGPRLRRQAAPHGPSLPPSPGPFHQNHIYELLNKLWHLSIHVLQTGTGFITMDKPTGGSFELSEDPDAAERHASSKGNPATNEWIPSADTVGQTDAGCLFFLPCTLTIQYKSAFLHLP
jgi:hypothetical protein